MSILRNGNITKYKLLHNGQKLKKAFYNGLVKLWSAGCTILYHVDVNKSYKEDVDSGESCLHPKTFSPVKDGWLFHGWREDKTASGNVLTEKVVDEELEGRDAPYPLYGVFAEPKTIKYDGNGADVKYKWIVGSSYRPYAKVINKSDIGTEYVNGDRCIDLPYVHSLGELSVKLLLNNAINCDGTVAGIVAIEFDFVARGNVEKGNGYRVSLSQKEEDGTKSIARFVIKDTSLEEHFGANLTRQVATYSRFEFNHFKCIINKRTKMYDLYINGERVTGRGFLWSDVTDFGTIRIHTVKETNTVYESDTVHNSLLIDNLKVYEVDAHGLEVYSIDESYDDYKVGTLSVDTGNAVGNGPQTTNKYYNNGNTANAELVLPENGFVKEGYSFLGWALGKAGERITINAHCTTKALWAQTVKDYSYSGGIQMYTAPADGRYLLEVWGARGGNSPGWHWYSTDPDTDRERWGGLGGYSYGNITLTKGETIYICVGGQGGDCKLTEDGTTSGGYNGGGSVLDHTTGSLFQICGGGGCTHIGRFNTTLAAHGSGKDLSDEDVLNDVLNDLFIVAGGGGGSAASYDGGLNPACGGAGGGETGGEPVRIKTTGETITGLAGTQIGPGTRGADIGGFGYGADAVSDHAYASAGGGGLWGGNTGVHYWSGGGGSGYIGGVTNGKTLRGGFTLDEYGNVVLDDNRMPVPNGEEGYIPSGTADGKARITYLGAV